MSKKYMQILCILISILLTLSVTANFSTAADSKNEKIVLVENGSSYLDELKELGTEIIDKYNNYVLIKISKDRISEYESYGMRIDELKKRTTLHVKSHSFDFKEGEPDIEPELKKKSYKKGTEGLYIVHMLGPINPEWRNTVEDKGVKVINYVPNYAYEVKMTPKQAQEIKDLFFVDWVGIYHPGFKLSEDLEAGKISVTFINSETKTMRINNRNQINEIAHRNDVDFVNQYSKPEPHAGMATQITGGGCHFWDPDNDATEPYRDDGNYGSLMNQLGYEGDEVTIAIADTGFYEHDDYKDRIIGGAEYDGNQWNQGIYGDGNRTHGTHVTGIVAGDTYHNTKITIPEHLSNSQYMGEYYAGQGSAPSADLYLQQVVDHDGYPNYKYEIIENAAQNSDAYIHSNSWGFVEDGGEYTSLASSYDEAVRDSNRNQGENQPMIITASAGNQGRKENGDTNYSSVEPPSTGKNVIGVGGTETFNKDIINEQYGFHSNPEDIMEVELPVQYPTVSAKGWTDDNRIKPDVVAPGEYVISAEGTSSYTRKSGTSMSAPNVAGQAAVIVDWYESTYNGTTPSPAMVKALLINTANDLDSSGSIPNKHEGWGMVDISKLERPKSDPVPFTVEDQERLLTTGKYEEYKIEYDRSEKPLKISLVWTDKEASAGSNNSALINDLNLKVISPSGDVYKGNAFSNGWTQKNTDTMSDFNIDSDGYDDVNNVENVYIESPEQGTYKVRVLADNIAADANNDGSINQDFAIVAYNAKTALDLEIINPPVDGWETFYHDVTVEWEGSLMENELNSKKVKLSGAFWVYYLDGYEHHIYEDVPDGWYTVYVKETDRYGNSVTESRSFQVDSN